jgi:hypothetical protein
MPATTLVSFEDLYDGPFHFNDLSFSFTNTGSLQCPYSAAYQDEFYIGFLVASGGTPPYEYATEGDLPPGLTLSAETGEISGIPTTPGEYAFTATATDAAGAIATADCAITVSGPLSLDESDWGRIKSRYR